MLIRLTEDDIKTIVLESCKLLFEMPSLKTAIQARNNAMIKGGDEAYNNYNDDNDNKLSKRANQISRFNNYAIDTLKQVIGTKVQIIIKFKDGSNGLFYIGKILDVKQLKVNRFSFLFEGVNESDETDKIRKEFVFDINYYDNNFHLMTFDEYGNEISMNFSNKRARNAIATLLNKKGEDEFLKPIR